MLPTVLVALLPRFAMQTSCVQGVRKANGIRSLTSAASDPDFRFDGEAAALYSKGISKLLTPSWERQVTTVSRYAVSPLSKVLDIASGPGQPAMMLAQTFPQAHVLSTDLSADMVEQARQNVAEAGLKNVACEVMDMQVMNNVANDSIDVCTSSFGYIFAPDINKALSETYRVLRPGGLVAATVWVDSPMITVFNRVMTEVLGHAPPPPPVDPMALGVRAAFDGPLATAGFRIISDEEATINFTFDYDPDQTWRMGLAPLLSTLQSLADGGKHSDVFGNAQRAFNSETAAWLDADRSRLVTPNATYRLVVAQKAAA